LKQFKITARLGLTGKAGRMMMSRDLAAVKKAHEKEATRTFAAARGQMIAELALLRKELWESWHLSRRGKDGNPRPGDPRLAAAILASLAAEAEVLDLPRLLGDQVLAQLEQLKADDALRRAQPALPYGHGWDALDAEPAPTVVEPVPAPPERNGHARLPEPPDDDGGLPADGLAPLDL
jgi:hypothetical protein